MRDENAGATKFHMLENSFFDQDSPALARALIGKVLRRRWKNQWLSARIIETEAYKLDEKGSHASLGYTHKRRALFMDSGTIYMYYSRGGDSFNISGAGEGNAVLIKSAYPWIDPIAGPAAFAIMQVENPGPDGTTRPLHRLCAGQVQLCRALALRVPDWDAQPFDPEMLFVDDVGESPAHLIQTTRLGITAGRDESLPYRFVDPAYAKFCTRNPLRRGQTNPEHYCWIDRSGAIVLDASFLPDLIPI
ncbi:DNA-3-methyladenine glycosylase [Undibacterium terreum]|uniref:Putative 3-methyladenine DNA glycosylase n=1 Tax=Undibacterium terreum TaxID=1224302 RepID=A0A916X9S0_9BURK|nr:DNA-3-methyladenine glycosylase [Undibacterium terreum]GGC57671.1 putative 3-methyladenine DNA glycosylase [Undibacterium terreum]